jgi:hypothetical protein
LQEQESRLEEEKQQELQRVEQELAQAAQAQAEQAKEEKSQALAAAEQKKQADLAKQASELEAKKRQALGQAEAEFASARADAEAKAKAEQEQLLAQAEQAHASEMDSKKQEMEAEKTQALANQRGGFDQEKDAAVAETEKVYARLLDHEKTMSAEAQKALQPFIDAGEARDRIVDELSKNFGSEFDSSAVKIDGKTGKVRLNFQESHFVRGSDELSEKMKAFLRVVIPKYAKSIYDNPESAKHVKSLKLSGMTSPVYNGRYVDINDTSPATARARRYNMELSNNRSVAMYDFIFDEAEMGNYKYRDRMKRDMSISAVGYQKAKPVPARLVGKLANCQEYDCKQEQATILQFNVFEIE